MEERLILITQLPLKKTWKLSRNVWLYILMLHSK